jgi:hypothetical protein
MSLRYNISMELLPDQLSDNNGFIRTNPANGKHLGASPYVYHPINSLLLVGLVSSPSYLGCRGATFGSSIPIYLGQVTTFHAREILCRPEQILWGVLASG